MTGAIRRFTCDESGATAMEYALIVALIGIAIVASLYKARSGVQGAFTSVVTGFQSIGP